MVTLVEFPAEACQPDGTPWYAHGIVHGIFTAAAAVIGGAAFFEIRRHKDDKSNAGERGGDVDFRVSTEFAPC
mgnify:CR=1 FL=1